MSKLPKAFLSKIKFRFKGIKKSIGRKSTPLVAQILPPNGIIVLLNWISLRSGLANICSPFRQKRFKRYLSAINYSKEVSEAKIVRLNFACNFFSCLRIESLQRCDKETLSHWIKASGFNKVKQALSTGNGVLLVSAHTAISSRIARHVLLQHGFQPPVFVGKVSASEKINKTDSEASLMYAQNLYRGREALLSGGIAFMAPDAKAGSSATITAPFCGFVREFKGGFAQLALATSATVIPVVVCMNMQGQLEIRFLDPLDSGDERLSEEERIQKLVTGYAKFLEHVWLTLPWLLQPHHLRMYFRLQNK